MPQPAARQNDPVTGVDIHIVMVPGPNGETPVPLPHPFSGKITGKFSTDVKIKGKGAALVGSEVQNSPSHIATPPGTRFQNNPKNKGEVKFGSLSVKINGKAAARMGDSVATCNDPVDMPTGVISAGEPSVLIG